jgi:glycosyltransferase involved in cell wall biosynthesis
LAAARNTGIARSTAERIVFLDADDRLMPTAFRVGLASLDAEPRAAFTVGTWRLIGHDGSLLSTPRQTPVVEDAYRALLRMCFISTPAAVMYRRTAVVAAGGFDPSVSPSADYDLYLRLARTWPVHRHGQLVAEYRRHGANMTLNRGLMLEAELTVLRRQWRYVRHDDELVEALWEGLHRSQDYHGGRLAQDVRANGAIGRWRTALRGGLVLLRHHPAALVPAGREAVDVVSDLGVRLRHAAQHREPGVRSTPHEGSEFENGEQSTWVP